MARALHLRTTMKIFAAACALLLASSAVSARAQAIATASKTVDFSVFGGYQFSKPDFGNTNNTGGTIGVDYTRYTKLPVDISLEVRGNYSTGDNITEKALLGGFKFDKRYKQRYYPYVDFLIGGGSVRYDHTLGLRPDRGIVYSIGGGVDIQAYKNFFAKVDVQSVHYNLGEDLPLKPSGDNLTYSPLELVVGVAYRLPDHIGFHHHRE